MSKHKNEGIKEIVSVGTGNLETFKRFLLENGFAHIDEKGNVTTGAVSIEQFFEIHENISEKANPYHCHTTGTLSKH